MIKKFTRKTLCLYLSRRKRKMAVFLILGNRPGEWWLLFLVNDVDNLCGSHLESQVIFKVVWIDSEDWLLVDAIIVKQSKWLVANQLISITVRYKIKDAGIKLFFKFLIVFLKPKTFGLLSLWAITQVSAALWAWVLLPAFCLPYVSVIAFRYNFIIIVKIVQRKPR